MIISQPGLKHSQQCEAAKAVLKGHAPSPHDAPDHPALGAAAAAEGLAQRAFSPIALHPRQASDQQQPCRQQRVSGWGRCPCGR